MAAHFPPYTKLTQEPTGAYRSSEPTDNATRAVIQAMQRLASASELLSDVLDLLRKPTVVQPNPQTAKQSYDTQTRRDVAWSVQRGDFSLPKWHVDFGKPRRDDLPPNLAASVSAPNCDGYAYLPDIGIGYVEPHHPMAAEALRQADEFERGDKETGV